MNRVSTTRRRAATPLGLKHFLTELPKVAPSSSPGPMEDRSQPWAGGRNPVGIERALSRGFISAVGPWLVFYINGFGESL